MDAQAIKNLSGALQIVGVILVVFDLLNVHDYLGHLKRLTAWLQIRRARVVGWLRRVLRLRGRDAVAHAGTATATVGLSATLTGRATPGPFTPQPDQPPAQQLAAQAEYLNRLRDWIMREVEQRDRAIEEERAQGPGRAGGGGAATGASDRGGPPGGRGAPEADHRRDRAAVGRRADPAVRSRVLDLAGRLGREVAGLAVPGRPRLPGRLRPGRAVLRADLGPAPPGQQDVLGPVSKVGVSHQMLPAWDEET